jgi:hypothetical protein
MKRIFLIATIALAGCATQPEPLQDRSQPYLGGKWSDKTAVRPTPRPSWVKCPRGSDRAQGGRYPFAGDPTHYCAERDDDGDVPREVECTMWRSGVMLANNSRGKRCAVLS